jgi:hypothetical protein
MNLFDAVDDYIEGHYQCKGKRRRSVIENSDQATARAIYYYPKDKVETKKAEFWNGWHNDYSYLTGLISPMYLDNFNETGIWIMNKQGDLIQLKHGENDLAF